MSCDIISICSSDEDYEDQPPKKKSKKAPELNEISLIPYKTTKEIVELGDSEDDNEKNSTENGTIITKCDTNALESSTIISNNEDNETENTNNLPVIGNGSISRVENEKSESDTIEVNGVNTKSKSKESEPDKNESIGNDQVVSSKPTEPINEKINSHNPPESEDDDLVIIEESDNEVEDPNNTTVKKSPIPSESIVIDDDSSSEGEERNKSSSSITNHKPVPSTSTEKLSPHAALLKKFISIVEDSVANSKFEEIIPKQFSSIQRYFRNAESNLDNSFETFMEENCERAKKSAAQAVIMFNKVKEYIKSRMGNIVVEIDEKHILKVRKLEKAIKLLINKITELEETECNFSDEENSAYMQQERYQQRLKKVFKKYCKYLRKNPNSGRITYDKIGFSHSKFNVINLAINANYKDSQTFPSYYEVEKIVAKAAKEHHLDLSETMIKLESEQCFRKLGEILQKRRKTELYQTHHTFIENTDDPATENLTLENTLKKNFIEGKAKIEEICQLYASKQDLGEDKIDSENSEKESEGEHEISKNSPTKENEDK